MESGNESIDMMQYKAPTSRYILKINQNHRFNLIRSHNSDTSTPTLQLFKMFATALQDSDQFLSLLSVNITKPLLPSLSNKTQIATTDNNKMQIHFKSYFNRQMYSLSGFFHISSSLPLDEIITAPKVYKWLESNHYSIKPSPSNADKMVQIGALCFSSDLIYREDLKLAIQEHPSWVFLTLSQPPIIHLTKGNFKGPIKSTKMMFVCCEKSKQLHAAEFFSNLYDGTAKEYPNVIMMLFIPLNYV